MDFLKKGQELLNKGSGSNQAAGGQQPAAAGQQKDYGDKAFDFASKKSGHTFDPSTSEKITDGIRGAYEKASGSKVDPKYSN